MQQHVLTLLNEVLTDKAAGRETVMHPATAEELAALQAAATRQLDGYTLPATYQELLARTNGLDCNGTVIYATSDQLRTKPNGRVTYERMGLVEANTLWRDYEPNKDYVFLAEAGDRLYCHNLVSHRFEVVDRVTQEVIESPLPLAFDTLDPMLERIFHEMLNHFEVLDPNYVPEDGL